MAVTQVFTNLSEFSRYHKGTTSDRPDLSVIVTTIEVDSPVVGDTLSVALYRLDGYGAVVAKTVTLTTATTYTVNFDLNMDGYVQTLPNYNQEQYITGIPVGNASDNIYRAKQGDYVIQVTDASGNVTESPMFAISIVPVWEINHVWARGITWWDYEVLKPRVQPQVVTGVQVTEVSENHYKGPFTLEYTVGSTVSTLSWGGGQAVPISGQAPTQLLLINSQQDFIMVEVSPTQLPATSESEVLYIDNGRISERAMIDAMRRATSYVQEKIICKIEPEIVDTDPALNGYADEVAIPETYYRPSTYNKWMSFRVPYPRVLYPGDLTVTGYFGFTQTATVPRNWLSWDEVTGIVELVPSSSSVVIWSFYNSVFVMAYLFNYESVPSFWHYRGTVGLRDLWNERAIIRECIAKKTVLELLNTQGSAYRAGFASKSTSRDGVSQSESYTSSAMYGVFAGHITSYQAFLEKELPKAKQRFGGISYVTI